MTTTACGLPGGCHSRVKILMPSTPLKLPSVMANLLIERGDEYSSGVALAREVDLHPACELGGDGLAAPYLSRHAATVQLSASTVPTDPTRAAARSSGRRARRGAPADSKRPARWWR